MITHVIISISEHINDILYSCSDYKLFVNYITMYNYITAVPSILHMLYITSIAMYMLCPVYMYIAPYLYSCKFVGIAMGTHMNSYHGATYEWLHTD